MAYGRNEIGSMDMPQAAKPQTKLQDLVMRLDSVLRAISRNNTRTYAVIENADGSRPTSVENEKALVSPSTTLSRFHDLVSRLEGETSRMEENTNDLERLF